MAVWYISFLMKHLNEERLKIEKNQLIQEITDMLYDMDVEQLRNCHVYVTNEYSEKDHEDHALRLLIKTVETKTELQLKHEASLVEN